MTAVVRSVHLKAAHAFSKDAVSTIELVEGHGVAGDAHFGTTVKHRSRVAKDPTQPNLRQVHLLHHELLDELAEAGLHVAPGQMGENITTSGLPLLCLGEGTVLRIGSRALVRVTGLRNPARRLKASSPVFLRQCSPKPERESLFARPGSWEWSCSLAPLRQAIASRRFLSQSLAFP